MCSSSQARTYHLSSFPWPSLPRTLQERRFNLSWSIGGDSLEPGHKPFLEAVTCANICGHSLPVRIKTGLHIVFFCVLHVAEGRVVIFALARIQNPHGKRPILLAANSGENALICGKGSPL